MRRRFSLEVVQDLGALAGQWDDLAARAGSPFLTTGWFAAWRDAFSSEMAYLVLRDADGRLRAGAAVEVGGGTLSSAANVHSPGWDVLAASAVDRQDLWRRLLAYPATRFVFRSLVDDDEQVGAASSAAHRAGYSSVTAEATCSPWVLLPRTYEELLTTVSRNHRQQLGRRRRALQRMGSLRLRTNRGDAHLHSDLDAFLAVEASGWKGTSRTAISCDPRTERFYRSLAATAARAGWLRLRLLELDGTVLAGDLALVYGHSEYLLKTGYDYGAARVSPGVVLRGEALRAAVQEGLDRYEFLGGPDRYKLDWTDRVRRHVDLYSYTGWSRPLIWARKSRPVVSNLRMALQGPMRWRSS